MLSPLLSIMNRNVSLNNLQGRVVVAELNWLVSYSLESLTSDSRPLNIFACMIKGSSNTHRHSAARYRPGSWLRVLWTRLPATRTNAQRSGQPIDRDFVLLQEEETCKMQCPSSGSCLLTIWYFRPTNDFSACSKRNSCGKQSWMILTKKYTTEKRSP